MSKTSIVAKLTVKPGKRDELVAAFKAVFEAVEEEAGTEVYALGLDEGDDDVAWVYELYTDADAMSAHNGSDAMAAMVVVVGPLLAGAPELNVVKPTLAKGLSI